jgi:phosphoesterase RecJ-like protein
VSVASTPRAIDWEPVLALLREHASFVLSTHVNPDGDALGSEAALGRALLALGKKVRIVNASDTPANFRFLESPDLPFEPYTSATHDAVIRGADVIAVLDTSECSRLGTVEPPVRAATARKLNIDHHLNPEAFADVAVVDPTRASSGELIDELLRLALPGAWDKRIAESLYVAIMTDTGSFRFPRTTPAIHRTVAVLIERGADPTALYDAVFNTNSPGRIRLLGEALGGMTLHADGAICLMIVTSEMLRRTGATVDDLDGFVHHAMSIDGVKIGILLSDIDGTIKASFRSHGSIPANLIARSYGGGGHLNAAGARISRRPLGEIAGEVVTRAATFLHS